MIIKTFLMPLLLTMLLAACSRGDSNTSAETSVPTQETSSESNPIPSSPRPIEIENAYMFSPAPGQKNGAIYLKMTNTSEREVMVLDAATTIAGMAMIHRSLYEEGMMRMKHVHHLTLAPGQSLSFEPNGYHIMMMDLAEVPAPGERFSATLTLSGGATLEFDVAVKTQQ